MGALIVELVHLWKCKKARLVRTDKQDQKLLDPRSFEVSTTKPLTVLDFLLRTLMFFNFFASQHYFPLNKVFGRGLCPIWEKTYSTILNLFNDLVKKNNLQGIVIPSMRTPKNIITMASGILGENHIVVNLPNLWL